LLHDLLLRESSYPLVDDERHRRLEERVDLEVSHASTEIFSVLLQKKIGAIPNPKSWHFFKAWPARES
jgi:hypothetical protein